MKVSQLKLGQFKLTLFKPNSLIRRMLIASIALLPLLLSFSAFMLNRAYISSIEDSEKENLSAQIYALMAVADIDNITARMPGVMANPRFETSDSGLYARVWNGQKKAVWNSNSLISSGEYFNHKTPWPISGEQLYKKVEINNLEYNSLRFATLWEIDDIDYAYTFEVLHSRDSLNKDIRRFQKGLFIWLGGMAVLLIAIQLLIVRWGLRPLATLANEITDIEKGRITSLIGRYPSELNSVTENLNRLIRSEHQQRERYKNSLADLAHSLKTPLTVMRSLLPSEDDDLGSKAIDEQIERMSTIVSHQLRRASAQVKAVYHQKTNIGKTVARLSSALAKVYHDKGIEFVSNIPDSISCAIEEDDLMEILGNLTENAFKYCRSQVHINVIETHNSVLVRIGDDGPGVPDTLKTMILRRGARADTSKIGQGIGLAITVDILSSYNAALSIEKSNMGGAEFCLDLPKQ